MQGYFYKITKIFLITIKAKMIFFIAVTEIDNTKP